MQCANCDREIMQEGSQFCPFCASPITFVDQPKKKKNEEISANREAIIANRPVTTVDDRGSWLAVFVFCAPLFAAIAIAVAVPTSLPVVIGFVVLLFIVGATFYSAECEKCGHFFTMQRTSHEKISTKKIWKMLYGKHRRQIVVLRVVWKDHSRCSHCGHEKEHVYAKDYESFSE